MHIKNIIFALTVIATAYKSTNHRNEVKAIKAEMLDKINRQLNAVRASHSDIFSDDSSMSSLDYDLFYGDFEPIMFN